AGEGVPQLLRDRLQLGRLLRRALELAAELLVARDRAAERALLGDLLVAAAVLLTQLVDARRRQAAHPQPARRRAQELLAEGERGGRNARREPLPLDAERVEHGRVLAREARPLLERGPTDAEHLVEPVGLPRQRLHGQQVFAPEYVLNADRL